VAEKLTLATGRQTEFPSSFAMTTPDRYAVIGSPVKHSLSPFIHGLFAKQTHQNLTYRLLEVTADRLAEEVARFFDEGGKGLNVTVPHKQAVVNLVKHRTPRADIAGAVNTIAAQSSGLMGDNTDGAGLIADLTRNLDFPLVDQRILILGAGGAARGVLGPILAAAPAYCEIANRSVERARDMAEEFRRLGEVRGCGFDEISTTPFDFVLNATSASLQDTVPPIPAEAVAPTTFCYDMAYGKNSTAFTRWAQATGAGRCELGWGMLVEQAAEAFLLWRGIRPDTHAVLAAIRNHQ
jgi:shikimate dehydrogenase